MPTQTSIYVHNVPTGAKPNYLKNVFSEFGKVLRIDCHSDRGFAFINFETQAMVKTALAADVILCNGNTLRIESRDRANDGISKVPSPHEHQSNNNNGRYRKIPTSKKNTSNNRQYDEKSTGSDTIQESHTNNTSSSSSADNNSVNSHNNPPSSST